MTLYQYSRLNFSGEIRLLSLLPGLYDDPIKFKVFNTPFITSGIKLQGDDKDLGEIRKTLPEKWTVRQTLEGDILYSHTSDVLEESYISWTHPISFYITDLPRYEALSYTWGSPDNPTSAYIESSTIQTDEKPETTTLQIGQNATSALRHLRYPTKSRTLWIDAICVNQSDIAERNEQVQQMNNIYRFAERFVVWLGPASPNSQVAMPALEFLGQQVELTRDYRRISSPGCEERTWHHAVVSLPYDEETWSAIFDLLGQSWFERLWILQEIQLGNRYSVIQCGNDVVEWRLFRRAISTINDKRDGPSRELRVRMGPIKSMCWVRKAESLTALLNMGRRRKCSEARDKVYAILGLIPRMVANKIHPDYSLPVSDVFKDIFLTYLDVTHRFDLLQRCDNQEILDGLPSWAPHWSGDGRAHLIYGLGLSSSSISSAHTRYIAPSTLEVAGVRVTTISEVQSAELTSLYDAFAILRDLGIEKLQATPYVVGGTLFQAYASALCSEQVKDRFSHEDVFPTAADWEQLILKHIEDSELRETSKEPYFWHWVQNYTIGRRIVRTQLGHVGTSMGKSQIGDFVSVILGCDVPMILHPNDNGTYEVVGEAYIPGLMDGEVLLGPLPKPWKIRVGPGSEGLWATGYLNRDTNILSETDPRLDTLPPISADWELWKEEGESEENSQFKMYKHRVTGEIVLSDPRLLPDALEAEGMLLETIRLV